MAFDSGGATTGPMTVPFIMALGLGVSSVSKDDDNSFYISFKSGKEAYQLFLYDKQIRHVRNLSVLFNLFPFVHLFKLLKLGNIFFDMLFSPREPEGIYKV